MRVNFFTLDEQNAPIKDEVLAELSQVLDSNQYILGEKVAQFEAEAAEHVGVKHAVGLSSGTDALIVALMALDLQPGDEVITTPFTFFATVGSIVRAGATPVFADIDPETFNIDPDDIKRKITRRTKCIMPVHLYGQCADMARINAIAKEHGLKVIEDAAQAIGAQFGGVQAGANSDIGCFSFFPTKSLGGFGEGGMTTTNDTTLYNKMVMARNHGSARRYYHDFVGGNFRMHAFQAAGLRIKLPKLDSYLAKRRENAKIYEGSLNGVSDVTLPKEAESCFHTYNQYVIRAKKRAALQEYLQENGIGTQIYYPLCLHEQDCFKNLGYSVGDFPVAEAVSHDCLALPIYPELRRDEIEYVSEKIKDFYSK